jgi:putative peptidoglycan lipid II flippase
MGILNSHRHFLAPALAPVLFNISALLGLFVLAGMWKADMPVWAYSTGVLAGGALQLLIQVPFMKSRGISFRLDYYWKDPGFRKVLKLAVPALIGLLAAEVNILVDQLIASLLGEGSVAALSYGLRVTQVPQGIFAIALATALLPTLSRQTAMGKLDEAGRTLGFSTLVITGIMLPAALYMIVMAEPVVRVMFFRGEFSDTSLRLTAASLRFYSIGMVFYAAVKITAPVYYALKDTKTPVKIAIGCMGLNIILNGIFTYMFMQTGIAEPIAGLALASSISSMVNLFLLKRYLKGRIGKAGIRAGSWLALVFSGAGTLLLLMFLKPIVTNYTLSGTVSGIISLVLSGIVVMIVAVGLFSVTGGNQVRQTVMKVIRRRDS